MYDILRKNISKHIDICDEEWLFLISLFEERLFLKNEFPIQEGEVCHFHGFVLSGILRTYFLDQKGNVVNLVFHSEDWWFADIASFVTVLPSKLNTIAMEDTLTLVINRVNLELLFEKLPKFERFFRILNQRAYATLTDRYIEELTMSAKDRYFKFVDKRANIYNRISQQHIASYLGITKEYLSKIRAQKK